MLNLSEQVKGGTFCLSKAGMAEGTGDATVKINAPNGAGVDFAINGIMYHKADTDSIDPTSCTEQALGTTCLYIFTLNSSLTLDTIKGTEIANANVGNDPVQWPDPVANTCPIGGMKIATGTTAFQVGVDDITDDVGTGTITFYDFFAIPDAPQVS
jgi:hypothetical protein